MNICLYFVYTFTFLCFQNNEGCFLIISIKFCLNYLSEINFFSSFLKNCESLSRRMSTRLLRRLREENSDPQMNPLDPDEEDYEEAEPSRSTFSFLSNIESDSDSDSDVGSKKDVRLSTHSLTSVRRKEEVSEMEENIDSILLEFKHVLPSDSNCSTPISKNGSHVILKDIDQRDFDLDLTMRNMMNGCLNNWKKKRKKRTEKIFCQPRAEWGKKPETFIGGGLGMESKSRNIEDSPWPYCDYNLLQNRNLKFFRVLRSVEYTNLVNKYEHLVSNSGDINVLAMFIADYPFLLEPLFQFAMFLFSIGENDKGVNVLKRCLWIIECASLPSFFDFEISETINVIDYDLEENKVLFHVLFRYAQTSCSLGCVSTSCSVGRFLLSLDPFRDPCGILLALDYYALATKRDRDLDFVIGMVDSGFKIYDLDGHSCEISDMPNWAFSYAYALFRKYKVKSESVSIKDEDNTHDYQISLQALCKAISAYPRVPKLLLEKINVNVNSRSFQMDWKPIIETLEKFSSRNLFQGSKQISIFVDRSHKLWDGYDELKWLFEASKVVSEQTFGEEQINQESFKTLHKYEKFDPIDFSNTFRQIPQELNPLDPTLADVSFYRYV